MKLFVNKEACIGCGACVAIDPEHFDFDDNGYSSVISQDNIKTDAVSNAISSCPTNAINYAEDVKDSEEHDCDHCDKHCQCEDDDEIREEVKEDFPLNEEAA